MRVTSGMTADNAVYNLQQRRAALDTLQEQVSSGLVVNKPSDDPLTTRQLLDLQNQISAGDQYSSNITKGTLLLNVTNTALTGMSEIMQQVKKVAGDMVGGSTDPAIIKGAITNLAALKGQLVDFGNAQIGNQYVFAGFSNNQPFAIALAPVAGIPVPPLPAKPVSTASGTFSGTSDLLTVEISQGASPVPTTVDGGSLLRGTPTGVDILNGIDSLIAAIANNNLAGIATGIANMKAGADQVTAAQSEVAGSLNRFANAQTMITNNQNTLKSIYDGRQNVDYAKAGVELSQQTTAFNAALATTAKITQLSLLDYMK